MKNFNEIDRIRIIIPCGDEICLRCLGRLLKEEEVKQIICPVDQQIVLISKKFRLKALQLLESKNQEILNILCEKHPDQIAEYYCEKERELGCHQCIYHNHKEHIAKISHVLPCNISEFNLRVIEKLKFQKQRCQDLIDQVLILKQKKNSVLSEPFNKLFNEVQNALLPHTIKEEKGDLEIVYKTPNLFDFEDETREMFALQVDDEDRIKDWIGNNGSLKFELLYRGTRDGFDAVKFHQLCDNKGSTITLIKANTGRVFGGYLHESWKNNGAYQRDSKAFLFSMHHKTKHEQFQNQEQAVYFAPNFLAWFGSDLILYDRCNENLSSYSYLHSTYKGPDGCVYGDEVSRKHLADAYNFSVLEIEVFSAKNE
eukprot:403356764